MKSLLIILPLAATAVATTSLEPSAKDPQVGVYTVHGCYSSLGELQLSGTNMFNTENSCAKTCEAAGSYVAATHSNTCYCGDKYPPASALVDDSKCDEPCPGYAMNACGGSNAFTVLNTGVQLEVENSSGDSASSETSVASSPITSASSSSASSTSAATDFGTTTTATSLASTTTAAGSGSNSTSSVSTAAGSASSSASASVVGSSSASFLISLSSLNMAILGLGTAFLV